MHFWTTVLFLGSWELFFNPLIFQSNIPVPVKGDPCSPQNVLAHPTEHRFIFLPVLLLHNFPCFLFGVTVVSKTGS